MHTYLDFSGEMIIVRNRQIQASNGGGNEVYGHRLFSVTRPRSFECQYMNTNAISVDRNSNVSFSAVKYRNAAIVVVKKCSASCLPAAFSAKALVVRRHSRLQALPPAADVHQPTVLPAGIDYVQTFPEDWHPGQ